LFLCCARAGGSWISTGNEATFHGRYAFRRHFFQHAGFRFVQSDAPLSFRPEIYERDEKVVVSLEAHYGPEYFAVPNFSQALAQYVIRVATELGVPCKRVLDMGCASGAHRPPSLYLNSRGGHVVFVLHTCHCPTFIKLLINGLDECAFFNFEQVGPRLNWRVSLRCAMFEIRLKWHLCVPVLGLLECELV
jgi:hypothetical protein